VVKARFMQMLDEIVMLENVMILNYISKFDRTTPSSYTLFLIPNVHMIDRHKIQLSLAV
jgi:hypothetical protein